MERSDAGDVSAAAHTTSLQKAQESFLMPLLKISSLFFCPSRHFSVEEVSNGLILNIFQPIDFHQFFSILACMGGSWNPDRSHDFTEKKRA